MKTTSLLGVCLALFATSAAAAQTYPVRPIRFIVPLAAGGGMDMIARTPRPVIERLHSEIIRAVHQPEMGARLAVDGAEAIGSSPQEFATHVRTEHGKWAGVIRKTGICGD